MSFMAKPTTSRRKLFLRVIAILISFLYLLVCIVPYINAGDFWFVAALGLIFPFLLALLFLFLLIETFRRSKWALILLTVMLLGGQQISWTFGFHFFGKKFDRIKEDGDLRVMTWNVFRWDEKRKPHEETSSRNLMMDAVEQQYADVLCFQEFFQPYSPLYQDNLKKLAEMGYPYSYFYPTSSIVKGHFKFGMAIVSRYPIIDSAKFSFGQTPHSEGLMYVDIKTGEKVFRIFSVHMESFRMGKWGYFDGVEGKGSLSTLSRLKGAYSYRSGQAELVRSILNQSPYPVILCGNLGDVPNSYAYNTVKKDMKDAFIQKGAGLGATFKHLSPTLRLDYVLVDPSLEVEQFDLPKLPYSDHYPLIVDVR